MYVSSLSILLKIQETILSMIIITNFDTSEEGK